MKVPSFPFLIALILSLLTIYDRWHLIKDVSAKLTGRRSNLYFIEAKGSIDGKLCVSGQLSVALIDN